MFRSRNNVPISFDGQVTRLHVELLQQPGDCRPRFDLFRFVIDGDLQRENPRPVLYCFRHGSARQIKMDVVLGFQQASVEAGVKTVKHRKTNV